MWFPGSPRNVVWIQLHEAIYKYTYTYYRYFIVFLDKEINTRTYTWYKSLQDAYPGGWVIICYLPPFTKRRKTQFIAPLFCTSSIVSSSPSLFLSVRNCRTMDLLLHTGNLPPHSGPLSKKDQKGFYQTSMSISKENYNTPLEHTPGNLPSQLWKESLYSLLVNV